MTRRGVAGIVVMLGGFYVPNAASGQQPTPGLMPATAVCARDATTGSATERTLLTVNLARNARRSTLAGSLLEEEASALVADLSSRLGVTPACQRSSPTLLAHAWYNTGETRPDRDGALWQGRGVTASVSVSISRRYRFVSAALRPLFFFSENRAYEPSLTSGSSDTLRHPVLGTTIDLPYRLTRGAFGRLHPGETFIRFGTSVVGAGVSSETQQWGPAAHYPLLFSAEGPGYGRAFVELRRVPVGVGTVSAQWHVGRLEASAQSGLPSGSRSRYLPAAYASWTIHALTIGAERLFHVRKSAPLNWAVATLPFGGLLKSQSSDVAVGGYNQLAGAFARVAPAGAGIEVYGELIRDDHNANLRDLIGEPDHISGYVLGLRRAWIASGGRRMSAVTVERANGRITHLVRLRGQSSLYTHDAITEGHTNAGQLLGTTALLYGSGTIVSWSRSENRRALDVSAEVITGPQNIEGGTLNGRQLSTSSVQINRRQAGSNGTYGTMIELRHTQGMRAMTALVLGVSVLR